MGPRRSVAERTKLSETMRTGVRLQWGRDDLSRKGGSPLIANEASAVASMGPRRSVAESSAVHVSLRHRFSGFNGAATICRGKAGLQLSPGRSRKRQLQWGRDDLSRKRREQTRAFVASAMLQWGRDDRVAERRRHARQISGDSFASMGPRLICRGKLGCGD